MSLYGSDDYKGVTSGMDVVLRDIIYEAYSKDLSVKTTTAKIIMMKQGKYIPMPDQAACQTLLIPRNT